MKSQTKFKRNKAIRVLVSDSAPYTILDGKGNKVGLTLNEGLGIYMKNVNFAVDSKGHPSVVGVYQGDLEELRMNLSEGKGIAFNKRIRAFTDGKKVIKKAKMVQLYNGIIKVVID